MLRCVIDWNCNRFLVIDGWDVCFIRLSNLTQRALMRTRWSWSPLLTWAFYYFFCSQSQHTWFSLSANLTTKCTRQGVSYCTTDFLQYRFLFFKRTTAHICKKKTSILWRFNKEIMFKSFLLRGREGNKVHSLGLLGRWGSFWSWRLYFSCLWCWPSVEGKHRLLHCPWPVPSARNDSQRPNIQLSLQMGPRDKKKRYFQIHLTLKCV